MKLLPEVLAARAVHQYRRRDILAYVSLRQYLRNSAALRDVWSDEIAIDQTIKRPEPFYHEVKAFKEIEESSVQPFFRAIQVPGPNEILAETSLLAACAEAGGPFECHASVFSYRLSKEAADTSGVFQYYFDGFKQRHAAIAAACHAQPDAIVVYTDITKYYPSITVKHALAAWKRACNESTLESRYAALGEKLLQDADEFQDNEDEDTGILTGPMLSHLIGNLIFRNIDEDMAKQIPGGYFRYVDDIAIVAPRDRALAMEQRLEEQLARFDLSLNSKKRIETTASDWLTGADDFEEKEGPSWMTFVADMKRLLLFYPEQRESLEKALTLVDVRIRPLEYGEVLQERPFLERLQSLVEWRWFRKSVRAKSWIGAVVNQALVLRDRYASELALLLDEFEQLVGYQRKRRLYRLRFLVARMAYLGRSQDLPEISARISGISEMAMAATVYDALTSRDVTQLMKYGPTAAQSAAQLLRAGGDTLTCGDVDWSKDEIVQAYAVFCLNGLRIKDMQLALIDPVVRFSDWNEGSFELYRERNGYFRELGCIHGMDDLDANKWAIETAFDRDDGMIFDMQEIIQASS